MRVVALSEFSGAPLDAISVSIDSQAQTATIYEEGDTIPVPQPALEVVKALKKAELYAIAAAAINQLTSLYAVGEVGLFQRKEDQAIAYQKSGNPSDAPWLAEEARRRGKPIKTTVQTVLSKAAELTEATQQIIARRGLLCDAVDAADTIQAVEAVGMPVPPTPDPLPEPVPETEPPIEPELEPLVEPAPPIEPEP